MYMTINEPGLEMSVSFSTTSAGLENLKLEERKAELGVALLASSLPANRTNRKTLAANYLATIVPKKTHIYILQHEILFPPCERL